MWLDPDGVLVSKFLHLCSRIDCRRAEKQSCPSIHLINISLLEVPLGSYNEASLILIDFNMIAEVGKVQLEI